MSKTPIERLLAKVIPQGDCLVWQGSTVGNGYGHFWVDGKYIYVHRFMYEYCIGPIPDGFELDHLCRNRCCVNTAHLEPVTHRTNLLRGQTIAAQHASATHCPHGHPYSGTNLYIRPDGKGRGCRICRNRRAA